MCRWRHAPHMAWVVEVDGVVLMDNLTGALHRLGYPDAAVWDLVGREPTVSGLAIKIGPIAALDPKAAEFYVVRKLEEWAEAGLLVAGEERG